jgi:hypothetical protein
VKRCEFNVAGEFHRQHSNRACGTARENWRENTVHKTLRDIQNKTHASLRKCNHKYAVAPADMRNPPGMPTQISQRSTPAILPEEIGHIPHLPESCHAITDAARTRLTDKMPQI